MKNFLSVNDVTDVEKLLKIAIQLKANPYEETTLGKNKTIGLIFISTIVWITCCN